MKPINKSQKLTKINFNYARKITEHLGKRSQRENVTIIATNIDGNYEKQQQQYAIETVY